jgi:hypothetical protein
MARIMKSLRDGRARMKQFDDSGMSDTREYFHAIIYVGIFGILALSLGIYRLLSLSPGDRAFSIVLALLLMIGGTFLTVLFLNGVRTRRKRKKFRIKE